MKFYRKIITLFALLLLAGTVKKPWEAAIGADLRHDKLLSEPLNLTTRESIGQTSSAVALGGLRSVVASFWNIRAYTSFEESNWVKLEDQFVVHANSVERLTTYPMCSALKGLAVL